MKLYDYFISKVSENKFKLYSLICLQVIKEINKHGNRSRSEIFAKQKLRRQAWVNILNEQKNTINYQCFVFF